MVQGIQYDPPLPVSIVKEPEPEMMEIKSDTLYGDVKINQPANDDGTRNKYRGQFYDPPLPVSIIKEQPEPEPEPEQSKNIYGENANWGKKNYTSKERASSVYDPPLPNSMLEIKSTRGKHSTEKPVALMEWVLKYYSKEGDVVLDPTMGSGSTGVACKNMNRKFIGIEMDKDIFDGAVKRLE